MGSSFNKVTFSVIVLILLAISGCDSGVLNQSSSVSNQTKNTTPQANNLSLNKFQSPNHDQKMVMLAQKIPGLGGLFMNKSGQLTIYLTHPAKQKAQAIANLSSFKPLTKTLSRLRSVAQTSGIRALGKFSSTSVSNMVIKKGSFTFTELYNWKTQVRGKVFSIEGVYSADIDEARNKLVFGVKGKAAKKRVIKELVQLDVPREAFMINKISQPTFATSLRDQVSSYSGGIKITIGNGPEWCTMGPTVRWRENPSGPFKIGYITASHCTPPIGGGVHGTEFYQPTPTGNYAGIEIQDPLFAGSKCWNTGHDCRESDAALISYSNSNPNIVPGSIYKTTSKGHNNGSLQIPSYDKRFYIKGVDHFIFQFITNHKIGAKTGWTYGTVTDICRDFTVGGITVVCQNVVRAGVGGGDSGSPVFELTADPDSVIFAGVLSGRLVDNGTEYFWYSSVTRIKNELSGPNVHDLTFTAPPPPLSVYLSGLSYITQDGNYTWRAVAKHGTGSYNYQWQYATSASGPWTTVAFTKNYSRYVAKRSQIWHFWLRVKVTSGSEQATSTRRVTVTSTDCPPHQICPRAKQAHSNQKQ